jgi:hypothetical protein
VTEEMSGGLRHHKMKRAEPCGWTQIIKEDRYSLFAATQRVCTDVIGVFEVMRNQRTQNLTLADVLRDVEKLDLRKMVRKTLR